MSRSAASAAASASCWASRWRTRRGTWSTCEQIPPRSVAPLPTPEVARPPAPISSPWLCLPLTSPSALRVRKILNIRLFEDENGRAWSRSVMDRELEVLCISQFTLQCYLKGNKPDFHSAMPAELAQPFYTSMLEQMRSAYRAELIKDGQFGAYMQVHIQNDGPVTIELESPTGPMDSKQLAKQEKQQQRKEKTRPKPPSESGREKAAARQRVDPSASSGAEGDVSSEREP
uniref:D-aminoacyl-tRNA deacylase 1 n=1 Tax=Paramormyrops kingsleyae TaxID=1676925 RepID=A0A3B3RUN8_9TELE